MDLNTYTAPRLLRAYMMMAEHAHYRPAAPSDGLGHIQLSRDECADDDLLCHEALRFAQRFAEHDRRQDFPIGCANGRTVIALAYLIEAARCLCAGDQDRLARRLLMMAIEELNNPAEVGDGTATVGQTAQDELAAVRRNLRPAVRGAVNPPKPGKRRLRP